MERNESCSVEGDEFFDSDTSGLWLLPLATGESISTQRKDGIIL